MSMQKIGALVRSPENLLTRQTHSQAAVAFATRATALLFGSYPGAKAHDPEIFTAQVTRLFLDYPQNVVSDVVRDLPRKRDKNWDGLPSIARLTEELDTVHGRQQRARERDEMIERQLAEREEYERFRTTNPTRAEFAEKYPDIAKRLGWIKPEGAAA